MTQNQTIHTQKRQNHVIVGIMVMVVTLCWTPAGFSAATGPGIALKIGAQTLDHPLTGEKTTRARAAVELTSAMFWDNHADLGLSIGGLSFDTYDSEVFIPYDDGYSEIFYSDTFYLIDVRLAARFYPLDDDSPIRPYVGGGLGYYWLLDSWEADYYDTFDFPFVTYFSEDEDTDTWAEGFFPFITAGVTVPVGDNFELLFDFQADFEKDDAGFDLSGPIYMFGCRFRF